MRVLVTGATGLIGQETCAALAGAGHEVVALSRSGRDVAGAAETIAVDLLDETATVPALRGAGAEALVHLAWYDGPGRMGAKDNLDWAAATIRLVRTFAEAGGRRVIGAGSCAEYDWRDAGPFSEGAALNPQSLYGIAKARTGQMLMDAAPQLGLAMAWARIFFVYGPGEPEGRLLGDVIAGLRAGRPVPCTDGLQERDFMATPEIGRALAHMLDCGAEGPVNVASGDCIPVRDLIGAVADHMGGADLVQLGARTRPPDDPPRIAADVTCLRALGFIPRHSLEGVADAIDRTP